MTAEQIRKFYENKKDTPCPLTEKLIKSGYQQRSGGYISYAKECGIEVDYKKASPSQWWHLIKSWCDRSEPTDKFTRSIRCGELIFWMAEVSGEFSEMELKKYAIKALLEAEDYTKDGKMPLRTATGNLIIRDYFFKRIKNAVEKME